MTTRRLLDGDGGRIIFGRCGISASGLEVRREHLYIGNRPTVDDLLHEIVL